MIIVLKPHTSEENIHRVENLVKKHGLDTHLVQGTGMTIIGCIGDTTLIDPRQFEIDTCVDKVMHVQEPYKLANRAFHPEDSIIDVSGVKIGGEHLGLIAGPCSVESYEQVLEIAQKAKTSGANLLRGGAFKPRTSPYAFQGLGLEGLDILCAVREEVGLPIVTELMSSKYLDVFNEKVDLIQIGARNMQNFDLLKELGQVDRPILLKRGLNATYEEWIMSAEYIPVMKMSFSVNVVSVLLRLLQETLWIFSVSLFFAARHIFQLLLTQVMPAENGGLLSLWQRLQLLQVLTDL